MPFLRAGFNARNTDTGIRGWTRQARGGRFALAELRRFGCGDYFWYGARFLAWGEQVVLGTWRAFDLPWAYQNGLGHCDIATREEHKAWEWVEERQRELEAAACS